MVIYLKSLAANNRLEALSMRAPVRPSVVTKLVAHGKDARYDHCGFTCELFDEAYHSFNVRCSSACYLFDPRFRL